MRLRHTPFLLLLGACDDPPPDMGTRAIEDRLARMEARLGEIEARVAKAEQAKSSSVETILELPRATTGGGETTATVAITLAGTRAFLDGRPVTDEELGERLRQHAVDPKLPRHAFRHGGAVARQHHDFDPLRLQAAHGIERFRSDRVGDGEDGADLTVRYTH